MPIRRFAAYQQVSSGHWTLVASVILTRYENGEVVKINGGDEKTKILISSMLSLSENKVVQRFGNIELRKVVIAGEA